MNFPNYFKILGVKFNASEDEIKTAYRKLSKKFHPDVNEGDKFFEEKFKEIQEAYEILINPVRKEEYIRTFAQQNDYFKKSTADRDQERSAQNQQSTDSSSEVKSKRVKSSSIWSTIIGTVLLLGFVGVPLMKLINKEKSSTDFHPDSNSSKVLSVDTTNIQADTSSIGQALDTSNTHKADSVYELKPSDQVRDITISKAEDWIFVIYDDDNQRLEIRPVFTISNAVSIGCHAVAYFFDENGLALKAPNDNEYRATDGTLSSRIDFTPAYEVTEYNVTGYDFTIRLPYSELGLPAGSYNLSYKVALFDDKWNIIASSSLYGLRFKQD